MNQESDGERAIRAALKELKIKFQQEKEIQFLKGDFYGNRRADFFLPKYNLYIEYLGGWDKKDLNEREKERERYNKKKDIYYKNGVKCIWIYPNQLNYVSKNILDGIKKYGFESKPLPYYKDFVKISITLAIISGFLIIIKPILFFPLMILFLILFAIIIPLRCPNCKRVFALRRIRRDFVGMEKRPWNYRIETRYLYSDGSYKNSIYSDWKQRTERIKIYKDVKECKYCRFKEAKEKEENLDKHTRPKVIYTKRTKYINYN